MKRSIAALVAAAIIATAAVGTELHLDTMARGAALRSGVQATLASALAAVTNDSYIPCTGLADGGYPLSVVPAAGVRDPVIAEVSALRGAPVWFPLRRGSPECRSDPGLELVKVLVSSRDGAVVLTGTVVKSANEINE